MDTWLIWLLMRKRGFAPPRRRPFRRISLEDLLLLLANVEKQYRPFVLEDELKIADSLVKALKQLQLEDELSISDAVFNALRKISLEDEISVSGSLFNALRKIALEDEISITDSLKNVYKPLRLSDELVLAGSCVKSVATGSTITLEDELNIYGSLQLAYDTVKVLTLEDSLNISDSLKKSVTTIHLEDAVYIYDSLKLAKREISLEDELNVNDSLKLAKRKIQLEDGLDVADSLKLSVNKQTLEDSLHIGDRLVIHRPCVTVFDDFESGEFDTDTWCEIIHWYQGGNAIAEVTDIKAYSGSYALMFKNPSGAEDSDKSYMYRHGVGENYVKVSLTAYLCVLDQGLSYSGDEWFEFGLFFNLHNTNCGGDIDIYCKAGFTFYYDDSRITATYEDYGGAADEITLYTGLNRDTWYRIEIEGETNEDEYIATCRVFDLSGNLLGEHTFVKSNVEGYYGGNFGYKAGFWGVYKEIAFLIDDLQIVACKE